MKTTLANKFAACERAGMDVRTFLHAQNPRMTLTALAARVGVSTSRLHDYSTGRRGIPAAVLARVEEATGRKVTVKDFVAAQESRRARGQMV